MRGGLGCLGEDKAGRKRRETEDQLADCTTAVTGPLQDGTHLGMGRANFPIMVGLASPGRSIVILDWPGTTKACIVIGRQVFTASFFFFINFFFLHLLVVFLFSYLRILLAARTNE